MDASRAMILFIEGAYAKIWIVEYYRRPSRKSGRKKSVYFWPEDRRQLKPDLRKGPKTTLGLVQRP